jgi:hypothetical protein
MPNLLIGTKSAMKTIKDVVAVVLILVLGGVVLFDRLAPRQAPAPLPVPAVSGQVLGRAYAPLFLASYSDAWLAAARVLEEGKPVAEAQKTLQETWKDARVKAFTNHVGSSFALVLPAGAEPTTPEKRAQVVKLWRDFARGLAASD